MLKGIEAQLMVTRTADLARDASALQRKNDLTRDFLAVQAQALTNQEKQQIAQTLNAQEVVVHKDKQEKGQQGQAEQSGEEKHYDEEINDEYILPPSENQTTIDIKI